MPYRILLLEQAAWVQHYDPDGGNQQITYPTGDLVTTTDPKLAKVFPTFEAAWEAWRAQSTRTPLRPDGKPNRPMTAMTVELEHFTEE